MDGQRVLELLEGVGGPQFLSHKGVVERQWRKLQALLRFVHGNNAYYRDAFAVHGVNPDQVQTPGDLSPIPILTKDEIRANEERLISRGYTSDALLEFRTGGSTGKPLRLWISEDCSERRNACAWRHDRWTGWEIGEPVGALWGNPPLPRRWQDW